MSDDSAALAAENARLRSDLQALQLKFDALTVSTNERIQQLIDENELLAEANGLLTETSAKFQTADPSSSASSSANLLQIPDELLLPGAGIATREIQVVEKPHSFGNLLSVAIHAMRHEIVVTGGADKCICVHDWTQNRKLAEFAASAPVLDLAFNPNPRFAAYFIAAFMDGKHGVYRLVEGDGEWQVREIQLFHDHTRPGAMKVAWNPNGELFATGASDKSLHVYQCAGLSDTDGEAASVAKIKSFFFNGTVEAITFVPAVSPERQSQEEVYDTVEARNELLVIAVRDDCYVHYVDCVTFEKERINMNHDGIEHVSYTIMDLRISPSGKYLLAATDTSRHFVFQVKTNVVLRNLYGHKAGAYSQPRAVWHPSEKYVLSNTEDNGEVMVWCVASERVVETISAHDALVRDLSCGITTQQASSDGVNAQVTLVTVSYDKRLKVWGLDPEKH
ncbi:Wd40 repeat-containing protein, partial [Globisporangium splendens]